MFSVSVQCHQGGTRLRSFLRRLAPVSGRIEFLIVRTSHSLSVALHSRFHGRSYSSLPSGQRTGWGRTSTSLTWHPHGRTEGRYAPRGRARGHVFTFHNWFIFFSATYFFSFSVIAVKRAHPYSRWRSTSSASGTSASDTTADKPADNLANVFACLRSSAAAGDGGCHLGKMNIEQLLLRFHC